MTIMPLFNLDSDAASVFPLDPTSTFDLAWTEEQLSRLPDGVVPLGLRPPCQPP